MSLTTKSKFLTIRFSIANFTPFHQLILLINEVVLSKICCLPSEPDLRSVNIQGLELVVFKGIAHPKMKIWSFTQ